MKRLCLGQLVKGLPAVESKANVVRQKDGYIIYFTCR